MKGKKILGTLLAMMVMIYPTAVKAEESEDSTAAVTLPSEQVYTGTLEGVSYSQDLARDLAELVNTFRTDGSAWIWNDDDVTKAEDIKKDALKYDASLEQIAMQRAAEAAVTLNSQDDIYLRPDGTVYSTCTANGVSSKAEEITIGTHSPSAAFSLFEKEGSGYDGQRSRRNMLGDYEAIGVGCAEVNGFDVWVMEFGNSSDAQLGKAETDKKDVTMKVSGKMVKTSRFSWSNDLHVKSGTTEEIPDPYFTARLYNAPINGVELQLTDGISYTVTTPAIATVSGNQITARKTGRTKLRARIGTHVNTANLYVEEEGVRKMNRLYNPNSGEHFFTASDSERDNLVKLGWHDEGEGWYAPLASSVPVYRLYNPNAGEHHYTYDVKERNTLIKAGWNYEGIGWYSDPAETVPLYRVYNPNAKANNHHYTTDMKERDTLLNLGWHNEQIGWYGCTEPEEEK